MSYIIMKRDILRPGPAKIVAADKEEVEFVDACHKDKMVKVFIDRRDCEDYYYDRALKVTHYPIKLISIQGIPFMLRPGQNLIPATVYHFLEQSRQDQINAIQRNECIREDLLKNPIMI